MPIEHKAIKNGTMGIEDRTVTGIFAVHGNVDAGDGWTSRDRSHPGLFGDFTVEGRKRAVFLWQHNSFEPPIATIDRLFDVALADLPPAVQKYAPDATGGTAVTRTYLDTPRGNEVLAGLKSGALSEMSYAYDALRWDTEKAESEGVLPIRNLYQAELYDISDVNWGMNPATSADGSKRGQPIADEHAAVLAAVRAYQGRLKSLSELRAKEGRVLSGESRKRIEAAVTALDDATTALKDLLAATEPKASVDKTELRRLWLDYQRTIAHLNGVPRS
jgi:HK97 family phage prohead protease